MFSSYSTDLFLFTFILLSISVLCFQPHFRECLNDSHMDIRFQSCYKHQSQEVKLQSLVGLLNSWVHFSQEHNITSWIAHGTLLGWFWGQKILPWDDDLDMQMSAHEMTLLQQWDKKRWNQNGREYLLDINPHWKDYPMYDYFNIIDGRWIDTTTGRFIDLTVVHKCGYSSFCVRGNHRYQYDDIWPLQPSKLHNLTVSIPHKAEKLLEAEYGPRATHDHVFMNYRFRLKTRDWVPIIHKLQSSVPVNSNQYTNIGRKKLQTSSLEYSNLFTNFKRKIRWLNKK
jgi:hypothetical protein